MTHSPANDPSAPAGTSTAGALHDARLTRFVIWTLGWLPMGWCEILSIPVAVALYALATRQREAILSNLRALHPEEGPWDRWWSGARVFVHFAWTYLDTLWCLHHQRQAQWNIVGRKNMEALRDEPGGALIFTVHAGTYDLGSAHFASHLGRELHTVRLPERSESLEQLRQAEFEAQNSAHPLRKIHYNASHQHLGLLLSQLLKDGCLVGVQGDRVVGEVAPLRVDHQGRTFIIPKGPLFLAQMTRVPCYAVFLRRLSLLNYEVIIRPAYCQRDEQLSIHELSQRWMAEMSAFVMEHWDQWYVFEPIVHQTHPAEQTPPR